MTATTFAPDPVVLASMKDYAQDRYDLIFCTKPTPLMWALYSFLQVVTLGGQKSFMTRFTTLVGRRVYWGSELETNEEFYTALAHVLVHMDQIRRKGLIPFTLSYLTREGRAEIEFEAYQMSHAIAFWRGASQDRLQDLVEAKIHLFTSSAYGWMLTDAKAVRARLLEDLKEIRSGMYAMRFPLAHDLRQIAQNGSLGGVG